MNLGLHIPSNLCVFSDISVDFLAFQRSLFCDSRFHFLTVENGGIEHVAPSLLTCGNVYHEDTDTPVMIP